MNRPQSLRRTLCGSCLAVLCAFFLAACIGRGPEVTLHTLQTDPQPALDNAFAGFSDMILLLPVRLAPQLKGRGLFRRLSANEARASVNHLWAGPLDEQVGEALAGNLRELLATPNIALFPGPRYGVSRYQVEVELNEFSGDDQGFTIGAVYTISDPAARVMLRRADFQTTLPIGRAGFSEAAAAAAQSVTELSRALAGALLAVHHPQPPPVRNHAN